MRRATGRNGGGARRALVALCAGLVASACGPGDSSDRPTAAPAAAICRSAPAVHEHQLAAGGARASIDDTTLVHLEPAGAPRDPRDTAVAGVDRIPYAVRGRAVTRTFTVGDGPVARATVRDAAGATVVSVARGVTSRPVRLPAGAYTLELVSDAAEPAIVFVGSDRCAIAASPAADGASAALAAGRDAPPTLATPGITVQELPPPATIPAASIATAAFVGLTATGGSAPQLVTSAGAYAASFGAPAPASLVGLAVEQFFAEGGDAAYVASIGPAAPTAAALIGDPAARTGLYALDALAPGAYGTLVLPDLARLSAADAQQVIAAAADFAAARRAFLVADAPAAIGTPAAIATFRQALAAPIPDATLANVALYFPPLSFLAPDGATTVVAGAGGIVAGRYAATDAIAGPWAAPAGVTNGAIRSPVTPTYAVTDADQDVLNPLGIDAIRTFTAYGTLVYGARTLATGTGADAFSYVPARRTALMVEQSIMEGLQWVVFEPSDPRLWSAITQSVTGLLTPIWQSGGLFGATASQAFFVTCDASNNPIEDVALGVVNLDVGLALVNPAEFVVLSFQLTATTPD